MIVGYGVSVPKGSLAVMSVDTEEEARRLLTLTCATHPRTGEFVAEELAREQTLENLQAFSDRLAQAYEDSIDWVKGGGA